MYNDIINKLSRLKNLPRTGWLLRDIPQSLAENVAEHTFEVVLTAYVLAKTLVNMGINIDISKVLVMALFHDSEEAVIGDVLRQVKSRVQNIGVITLETLNELGLKDEIGIVKEYIDLNSVESILVKIADLIATINQGYRYLKMGYKEVKEIIDNCVDDVENIARRIDDPKLREQIINLSRNLISKIDG